MKDGKNELMKTLKNFKVIDDDVFDKEKIEKENAKREQFIHDNLKKIPLRYKDATFENYNLLPESDEFIFNDDGKQPGSEQKVSYSMARKTQLETIAYLKSGIPIVLYGNNGTGKTHLAFASMKNQIYQGKTTLYITFMEIMDEIHQCFGNNSIVGKIIEKYADIGYLVIDEIDKSYGSQSELINLFRIVNSRYYDKLSTVLITNAGKKDGIDADGNKRLGVINSVGRSSYERIVEDGTAVYMNWDSYRKTHRNNK